jgi:hypothetical protein
MTLEEASRERTLWANRVQELRIKLNSVQGQLSHALTEESKAIQNLQRTFYLNIQSNLTHLKYD